MRNLLLNYKNKNVTLVLRRLDKEFFLDCYILDVGDDCVLVEYNNGKQIIPFFSILRVEVKE